MKPGSDNRAYVDAVGSNPTVTAIFTRSAPLSSGADLRGGNRRPYASPSPRRLRTTRRHGCAGAGVRGPPETRSAVGPNRALSTGSAPDMIAASNPAPRHDEEGELVVVSTVAVVVDIEPSDIDRAVHALVCQRDGRR